LLSSSGPSKELILCPKEPKRLFSKSYVKPFTLELEFRCKKVVSGISIDSLSSSELNSDRLLIEKSLFTTFPEKEDLD